MALVENGQPVVDASSAATLATTELYDCPAAVAVGDAVYLTATGTVDRARANALATMPVVGVVQSKPSATTCLVQTGDALGGYAGLTVDAFYYASPTTPGALTATVPTTIGQVVQQVGFARTATTLVVSLGDVTVL